MNYQQIINYFKFQYPFQIRAAIDALEARRTDVYNVDLEEEIIVEEKRLSNCGAPIYYDDNDELWVPGFYQMDNYFDTVMKKIFNLNDLLMVAYGIIDSDLNNYHLDYHFEVDIEECLVTLFERFEPFELTLPTQLTEVRANMVKKLFEYLVEHNYNNAREVAWILLKKYEFFYSEFVQDFIMQEEEEKFAKAYAKEEKKKKKQVKFTV